MLISKEQQSQLESIAYRKVDHQEWAKPIGFNIANVCTFTGTFGITTLDGSGNHVYGNRIDLDFAERKEFLATQVLMAEKLSLRECEVGNETPFDFVFFGR
jgi:hypothetical protein